MRCSGERRDAPTYVTSPTDSANISPSVIVAYNTRLLLISCYTARWLAAQCIVIGPVCLLVCHSLWVCGWVCYHDNSKLRASFFTKLGL